MIYAKFHKHASEVLLGACDEDIMGKVFKEGELKLEVSEEFYKGEKVADEVFITMLKASTIANLTGTHVVNLAIQEGLVLEECILKVDGISHAQVISMA